MYPQPDSSPSSSLNVTPSSSPPFGPVDSSPPSSPTLVPYELDNPDVSFSHPFAASTKAFKRLPHYEKKPNIPPCTPPGIFARLDLRNRTPGSRSLQDDDDWSLGSSDSNSDPTSNYTIEREEDLWDAALREAFDKGIGKIDLGNRQIKFIPPSIGELSGFFNTSESSEQSLSSGRVTTWRRVDTEPSASRSFNRAQSIKDFGKERHVLMLYLMGNMITSLPPELFSVKSITVLSLRGNKLTSIPPDICRLPNLYELNISNNRLEFLPWEMRDMKIEQLLVHPNPFHPEPPSSLPTRRSLRSRRSISRLHSLRKEALSGFTPNEPVLSSVTIIARVPSFRELCLRLLLAPSEYDPMHNVMEEHHGLPLSDQWTILTEYVPGSLRSEDASTGMGMVTCPNPAHRGRVFVRHASERFSWERRVAGVHVGGAVPLRWLGCLATCLDYLDQELQVPQVVDGSTEPATVTTMKGGAQDDNMDVDMAVQVVDLDNVSFDMDGFED
ncbi:hypothetical protein JVU11DRAFT_10479 [Chiua virens]|nr:hypothetical protein JVU11DRAFT_10479 [Chiua virens]